MQEPQTFLYGGYLGLLIIWFMYFNSRPTTIAFISMLHIVRGPVMQEPQSISFILLDVFLVSLFLWLNGQSHIEAQDYVVQLMFPLYGNMSSEITSKGVWLQPSGQ